MLPLATVQTVFHLSLNLLAGSITPREDYLRQLVATHLLGQVTHQRRRFRTQRQRLRTVVRLAALVRHVGFHHEMVVHAGILQVVGQRQGHAGQEVSVVVRGGHTFVHHRFLQTTSEIARLPVPRIAHPPVGHAALHRVAHLCALHGHSGIGHCLASGLNGVAGLVSLLVFIKLHLEGRTLVFFYADRGRTAVGTHRKASVQQSLRQGERGGTLAIAVGRQLRLTHRLVVGVTQLHPDALSLDGHVVQGRLFLPHDGRHMHRLSGTVDAAVGKHVDMFRMVLAGIVGIASVAVHGGIILVVLRVGKQFRRHALHAAHRHFALLVTRQVVRLRGLLPSCTVFHT